MMQVSYHGGSHYTAGGVYSVIRELRLEYCDHPLATCPSIHLLVCCTRSASAFALQPVRRIGILFRNGRSMAVPRLTVSEAAAEIGRPGRPAVKFILLPWPRNNDRQQPLLGRFCHGRFVLSFPGSLYPRNANLLCRVIRPCADRIVRFLSLSLSLSLSFSGALAFALDSMHLEDRSAVSIGAAFSERGDRRRSLPWMCRGGGWFLTGTVIALGIQRN